MGQVLYHAYNWDYMPNSINKLFAGVKETIRPARDDGDIVKQDIDGTIDACAEKVRDVMSQHYKLSFRSMAANLRKPAQLSFDIAMSRLNKKYKLNVHFEAYIRENIFGAAHDDIFNALHMDVSTIENEGDSTVTPFSGPVTALANSNPSAGTATTSTTTLTTPAAITDTTNVLPAVTITATTNTYAQVTGTAPYRKRLITQYPGTTDSNESNSEGTISTLKTTALVRNHGERKQGVTAGNQFLQVNKDTNYLIIGDSNVRDLKIVHNTNIKTQVECYSGLQMHHLAGLLVNLPKNL